MTNAKVVPGTLSFDFAPIVKKMHSYTGIHIFVSIFGGIKDMV